MEYRLWWAFQLHRHKAFCSEIIQTLQYWLLEEQIPFRDCPAEPSKEIFSTQMPDLHLKNFFDCFRTFRVQKSSPYLLGSLMECFDCGIFVLENNPQTLIVGKICHDIGMTNRLFDGIGWCLTVHYFAG